MKITVLTLFPEVFLEPLKASLLGKAQTKGLVEFQVLNIRDFSQDKHRTVDDSPYGGGEGMLMRADVLHSAWKSVVTENTQTLLLSPQGRQFTQSVAKNWVASYQHLILVCGHYEGIDERFVELCVDEEISVGDYVCTGGEFPALVIADVVTRLIPGTVKNPGSVAKDSLEDDLLKYPQYTRPPEFQGLKVPDVLLSGDHRAIEKWRKAESEKRTKAKRPDLWERKK